MFSSVVGRRWGVALAVLATVSTSTAQCEITNNGLRANCANLGLTTIPASIPDGVYFIDLSENSITALASGSLDRFTALLDINFSGNSISGIATGTFAAQITRTNAPETLLPLSRLNMTLNPSICTLTGSRPSVAIACTCASGFESSPLTQSGREACTTGPPPPTPQPTLSPISAAPSAAPSTAPPTSPQPTLAPTSASPTVAPSAAPTTSSPTLPLSFETVGTVGCCATASATFYDWVQHTSTSKASCEALCAFEPACRGIETPWSIDPVVQGQCFLLVDSGATPVNSSFSAVGVGSGGNVTGVVALSALGDNCTRGLFQCSRICRAGATSFASSGCTGLVTTTIAPPVTPISAFNRLSLTLTVRPTALNATYWADQRPPAGFATTAPPFETAVAAVVCSERGAVFGTIAERDVCTQELRAIVFGVTGREVISTTTTLNFYVTVNGAIVTGPSLIAAMREFTFNALEDLFGFPVAGVSAEATATAPTINATASSSSDAKSVSFLTAALTIAAVIVVVIILVLVVAFAVIRLRKLRLLVSGLRDKSGRDKSGYAKLNDKGQYPYGPPSAMAQFYDPRNGNESPVSAMHVAPRQGDPMGANEMVINHTAVGDAARQPRGESPALSRERQQYGVSRTASTRGGAERGDGSDAELRVGMDSAPPGTTTSAVPPTTSFKLNFDEPRGGRHVEAVAQSFDLGLPHGAGASRW